LRFLLRGYDEYTVFRDVTPCSLVEVYRLSKERIATVSRVLTLFYAFLYGLLFDPEGGSSSFLRKAYKRLLNYGTWRHIADVNVLLLIKSATNENHLNVL
jgi:hypothetical protein